MRAEIDMRLPGDLLIESSIDAMVAIGTDDTITAWNRAASFLFNIPAEKAIGNSIFKILASFHEDAELKSAIQSAKEGKKSLIVASEQFAHRRHVETHVIPLRKTETVAGVLLLIHDVAHRIAKEQELRKLNVELQNRLRQLRLASTELAQLTHIASHNIWQPIREIYTTVEGLLRTEAGVIGNHGRASFRRIQSSLNRMNLLLDDITTLTQINITNPPQEIVRLEEVVNELRTQFAKKFHDSGTKLTVGQLCDVPAHRNQVLLLLQHIFSNVIKFAGEEAPKIHISSEKIKYVAKTNDTIKTGDYYLVSVRFNGAAFDNTGFLATLNVADNAEVQNYTGPAIAIILATKIMEVHAGFIATEKLPGGDTTINCFFPVNGPEQSTEKT